MLKKIFSLFKNLYYNTLWFFKNLYFFFKEMYSHRSWDYNCSLNIFQRSLEMQITAYKKYSISQDSELILKIERALFLITALKDDMVIDEIIKETTGLVYVKHELTKDNNGLYSISNTPEQVEYTNARIKLEKQLWDELWDIMKTHLNHLSF